MRDISDSGAVVPVPPVADMRYEDEDANRVTRVLVRVEWAGGKIREYEAEDPEDFTMNDPEREFTMAPMRMSVQAPGSPVVQMHGVVPAVRLSFRANPRSSMHMRTEATAPQGRYPGSRPKAAAVAVTADPGHADEVAAVVDCPQCQSQVSAALIGACASAGIERGMPTGQVLGQYLREFHDRGHAARHVTAKPGIPSPKSGSDDAGRSGARSTVSSAEHIGLPPDDPA